MHFSTPLQLLAIYQRGKCKTCKHVLRKKTKTHHHHDHHQHHHHNHHHHHHDQVKPLVQWEKLDMSSLERRKLCCSVTFHAVSIIIVIMMMMVVFSYSLYHVVFFSTSFSSYPSLLIPRLPSHASCGPSMF